MINEVIDNKGREGGQYETLLGSLKGVDEIATFWEKNAKLIQLIATDEMIAFCETEQFGSADYEMFRLGLGKIGAAMQECWKERAVRLRESGKSPQDSKN